MIDVNNAMLFFSTTAQVTVTIYAVTAAVTLIIRKPSPHEGRGGRWFGFATLLSFLTLVGLMTGLLAGPFHPERLAIFTAFMFVFVGVTLILNMVVILKSVNFTAPVHDNAEV